MTYKEKIEAYKNGTLDENERDKLEKELEKFSSMLDFFDENQQPIELSPDSNSNSISNEINKALNKRISKSVSRTMLTALLFVFLFVFGLFCPQIISFFGGSEISEYVAWGIYSIVYIVTATSMLYRSFAKKEIYPALTLLIWNFALVFLTAIMALTFGDAGAGFILPLYNGFHGLLRNVFSPNNSFLSLDAGVVVIALVVLTFLLSISGIIFSRLKIKAKPLPKNFTRIAAAIFVCVSLAVVVTGTVRETRAGSFPSTKIGAQAIAKQMQKQGFEPICNDYSGMTVEEALKILGNDYYVERWQYEEGFIRIGKKNSYNSIEFSMDENNRIKGHHYYCGYIAVNPVISIYHLDKIYDGSILQNTTENEALEYLYSALLFPTYIFRDGERLTYGLNISLPANDYHLRYQRVFEINFENGKFVSVNPIGGDESVL